MTGSPTTADASPSGLADLLRQAPRMLVLQVLVLSTLQALTEGVGVALLVPILAALGSGEGGQIGTLLARFGLALEPGPLLALFVAVVLARSLLQLINDLVALRLEGDVADRLRRRAWHAVLHAEWRHLAHLRQSSASSILISDLERVSYGITQAIALLGAIATLGALGLATLAISPRMALAGLAAGTLSGLAYRRARRRMAELGEQQSIAYERVFRTINEGLAGLRIIKATAREDRSEREFAEGFAEMRRGRAELVLSMGWARMALQGGGAALLAVLVYLAIARWQLGTAQILPLAAVFVRALPLLGAVQTHWQNCLHAVPALAEAKALIDRLEAVAEPPALPGDKVPRPHRTIGLDNVSLRQPGRAGAVLDVVTLELAVGSTVALVGPSGAGKSTLGDVLSGLLATDAGVLRIDGAALAGPQRRAWRERVAYVQQEPLLFHASIRENLLWAAPEANDEGLEEALKLAAAGFVLALPDGLDTVVGARGTTLSGGERQRIALARGLLREPDRLILDEATSALDPASEAAVVQAIAGLKGQTTILIISHRGALAGLADRTVTIEGGRIINDRSGAVPAGAGAMNGTFVATKG